VSENITFEVASIKPNRPAIRNRMRESISGEGARRVGSSLLDAETVASENAMELTHVDVLVKHQLLILNRSRKRSPNLRSFDRMVAGLCAVFIRPGRLVRAAIVFKPSTLLRLHHALIHRKYRRLFSSNRPMRPGPKGPSQDVIAAVVDMKRRNPNWGCPRIAQQIALAFDIPIDRDVVRRMLAARYQPKSDSAGPGDQDGAVRTAFPPCRRTADRDRTARMSGTHVVLDCR